MLGRSTAVRQCPTQADLQPIGFKAQSISVLDGKDGSDEMVPSIAFDKTD